MTAEGIPSRSGEQQIISDLIQDNSLRADDVWYPVDFKWWEEWVTYSGYSSDSRRRIQAGIGSAGPGGPRPGAIDNSNLVDPESPLKLKADLQEHFDFEMVHEKVWEMLIHWYSGGPAFPRKVISEGAAGVEQEMIELYPILVTIYRCLTTGAVDKSSAHYRLISRKGALSEVIDFFSNQEGIPTSHLRLWIREDSSESDSRSDEPNSAERWKWANRRLLTMDLEDLEIFDDFVVLLEQKNSDGKWLREDENPNWRNFKIGDLVDALDTTKKWFESTVRDVKDDKVLIHYNNWSSKWDEWINVNSDRLAQVHTYTTGPHSQVPKSPPPYGAGTLYNSYEYDQGKPIQKGIVGLRNLGNTCFMNSTLQCLTSTKLMLNYWLEDRYKDDLNRENPLGWQGKVASEYGKLVKEVWSGNFKVITPRGFKHTIGEFAPRFSGYNQQDSSELLSFLLDGIHEDLNRVHNKPYTMAVESNGRSDEIVAKEAWETHLKRHDSVIVDHFQGLLKSKLVCPTCNKVSVTFDPYMFLSVPLPSVSDKILEVTLLFSGASKPTTTFGVKVPQQGSVYNLKVALSRQANVPLQRLIIGEIWKGKIYKIFPNNHLLGDIRPGDKVWAWECPEMENFPPQKETEITTYEISQAVLCICKESNSYWLGSSSRVVSETFGVPFPLIFPSGQEVRAIDLHQQIDGLLSRFVKAPVSEGCDENDCSGPIEEPPYVIRPLDLGVQQAKDIIPKDDSFLDARMTSFAVDWQDVDRYDPSCIENIILDDSAPSKNPGSFGSTQQPSIHLSDCINCYTESEQLNEDNAWYCSSCKEFRCATKKFDLWSVPEVLIIHLKRFQYSRMYRDKIDSFVDFPLESLDMKEWVIGTQGLDSRPLKYDLYGISNHMGGLGGGHYTAFIKSIVDGQWYDISDSSVSPVSVENIKTSSAYVLFYTRQE